MARERQFWNYIVSKVIVRTLLLLAVGVFGFLAVDNWVARWDLTEDKRFSISPVSHRIAASLPDPLTIRAYFSGRVPERIRPMQRQVFDILAEYEAHGGGKIKVERYDPFESATARDEAKNYGVQVTAIEFQEATGVRAEQVYGSLVLIYGDRPPQVVDIAERYPLGYDGLSGLESELSRKIWQLTHDKPKVGLTGNLEREARGDPMMGMPQPQPEFTTFRSNLGDDVEIEDVDLDREDLDPKKVPLLLIVRPKEFTDVALFRLDQYMMKGGRVLMFVTQGNLGGNMEGGLALTPFKTGLDPWLEHHGIRVPNEIVCQLVNATRDWVVRTVSSPEGEMQMQVPVPNWFWPILGIKGTFDQDNPAVQGLKSARFFWPHPVEVLENRLEGKSATVLIRSHAEESWRWKRLSRIDMQGLTEVDAPSRGDLMSSPVVVALDGTFTSYFAERPVPPSLMGKKEGEKAPDEGKEEEKEPGAPEAPEEKKPEESQGPEVVKRSETPTQLVVVGNATFLSDPVLKHWRREAETILAPAINLLTWLSGSPELISLRTKSFEGRSILKQLEDDVEAIEKAAEAGEIDEATYRKRLDSLGEARKEREKRSRWWNVILPLLVVWGCGAAVWVVRGAKRSAEPRIPAAVPPASLGGGGSDS